MNDNQTRRPMAGTKSADSTPLLKIRDLTLQYRHRRTVTPVLRGVSLEVSAGETLGVVGESGSGKSQTMLAVLRLLAPGAELPRGGIEFEGTEVSTASETVMRRLRGSEIAMVFQDPMSSLDPVMRIGDQVAEALLAHRGDLRRDRVTARVDGLIGQVGLPDPAAIRGRYPHQLSGGQRQRIGIAMAMANNPRLLIADEPTTALDVTVQAQVLQLLHQLQQENEMAMVLITHDLALVSEYADRIAVMYAGEIVEQGPTAEVFANPQHPYTRGLLASRPRLEGPGRRTGPLAAIRGVPTDAASAGPGCAFAYRCEHTPDLAHCGQQAPELIVHGTPGRSDDDAADDGAHLTRCHFPILHVPARTTEED